MNLSDAIRFISAFAYTIAPFSALFLLTRTRPDSYSWGLLFRSVPWALAGFTVIAIPVSTFSLQAYSLIHAAITFSVVALVLIRRNRFTINRPFPWLPTLFITASILPLIIPLLSYSEWLGAGDMRFHNILAQSIIENGSIPKTWLPFADIPVNYPRGVHLLSAFISIHADLPVHTTLTWLLFVAQALSTGLIYLISKQIFKNTYSAVLSSIAYGFIANAGSLDYIRWGGVPNACAMMLTLAFVLHLLSRSTSAGKSNFSISLILMPAAIVFTHHYSALTLCLLVLGLTILTPLRKISLQAIINTAIGCSTAVLLLLISDRLPVPSADTSVLVFHEQPISLLNAAIQLNPAFVVIALAGMYLILKARIPDNTSIITSWVTTYFITFTLLEYCYRFAVFAVSGGSSFHTALTPSRLIADSAYPLSIAAGALGANPYLQKYRSHLIAILIALGIISSSMLFISLRESGTASDSAPVIDWIRNNTPENALLAGYIPHLEYLAWRKTTSPPMPASEARNHPSLVSLRSLYSTEQFRQYTANHNLECFFVLASSRRPNPALSCVYSNESISVFKLDSQNE